jgi:hypothetical protein
MKMAEIKGKHSRANESGSSQRESTGTVVYASLATSKKKSVSAVKKSPAKKKAAPVKKAVAPASSKKPATAKKAVVPKTPAKVVVKKDASGKSKSAPIKETILPVVKSKVVPPEKESVAKETKASITNRKSSAKIPSLSTEETKTQPLTKPEAINLAPDSKSKPKIKKTSSLSAAIARAAKPVENNPVVLPKEVAVEIIPPVPFAKSKVSIMPVPENIISGAPQAKPEVEATSKISDSVVEKGDSKVSAEDITPPVNFDKFEDAEVIEMIKIKGGSRLPLHNGPIVADFSLPYQCCDDCPDVISDPVPVVSSPVAMADIIVAHPGETVEGAVLVNDYEPGLPGLLITDRFKNPSFIISITKPPVFPDVYGASEGKPIADVIVNESKTGLIFTVYANEEINRVIVGFVEYRVTDVNDPTRFDNGKVTLVIEPAPRLYIHAEPDYATATTCDKLVIDVMDNDCVLEYAELHLHDPRKIKRDDGFLDYGKGGGIFKFYALAPATEFIRTRLGATVEVNDDNGTPMLWYYPGKPGTDVFDYYINYASGEVSHAQVTVRVLDSCCCCETIYRTVKSEGGAVIDLFDEQYLDKSEDTELSFLAPEDLKGMSAFYADLILKGDSGDLPLKSALESLRDFSFAQGSNFKMRFLENRYLEVETKNKYVGNIYVPYRVRKYDGKISCIGWIMLSIDCACTEEKCEYRRTYNVNQSSLITDLLTADEIQNGTVLRINLNGTPEMIVSRGQFPGIDLIGVNASDQTMMGVTPAVDVVSPVTVTIFKGKLGGTRIDSFTIEQSCNLILSFTGKAGGGFVSFIPNKAILDTIGKDNVVVSAGDALIKTFEGTFSTPAEFDKVISGAKDAELAATLNGQISSAYDKLTKAVTTEERALYSYYYSSAVDLLMKTVNLQANTAESSPLSGVLNTVETQMTELAKQGLLSGSGNTNVLVNLVNGIEPSISNTRSVETTTRLKKLF